MVTVPHKMVGLESMLGYEGVGLQRFHCNEDTCVYVYGVAANRPMFSSSGWVGSCYLGPNGIHYQGRVTHSRLLPP